MKRKDERVKVLEKQLEEQKATEFKVDMFAKKVLKKNE